MRSVAKQSIEPSLSDLTLIEDVDATSVEVEELDYSKLIVELQCELAKAKAAMEGSQILANVSKLRIYTDSSGICLSKFSAQCKGGSPDEWLEFDRVAIECVDQFTGKPVDYNSEFDDEEFFSDVEEDEIPISPPGVAHVKWSETPTIDEMTSLDTEKLVSSSDALVISSDPLDISTSFVRAPKPKLSAKMAGASMDVAVAFLEDLRQKEEEANAAMRSPLVSPKQKSLARAWFGDLPLYTRGYTIRVMKGMTSPRQTRAADFYMNLRRKYDKNRPIRVLSLDGGGLRASISAQLVREIEKGSGGVPLCKCFDLIVGTSVGGMFAIQLGKLGWTAAQCDEFLETVGRRHFAVKSTGLAMAGLTMAAKFITDGTLSDTDAYRKTVTEAYTRRGTLEDVPLKGRPDGHTSHVAATSVRSDIVPWRPFVFRSYNFGDDSISAFAGTDAATVCEGAYATTSVPVHLESFKRKTERMFGAGVSELGKVIAAESMAEFMDGGIYQNDPALTAFFEAKQLFGYSRDVLMVSIGTGHLPKHYKVHQSAGWMQIGKLNTLGMGIFEAKEVANLQVLRQLLVEGENYFRFDMAVETYEWDDYTLMPYFRKRAHAWLRKHDCEKAKLQALGRFMSRYADDTLPEDH